MKMPMSNVITDFNKVKKDLPSQRKSAPEVRNCADAAKWLKNNLDISVYGKSKLDIMRIAAENDVDFPNIPV